MSRLFFKLDYTVRELRIPPKVVHTFEYAGPHSVKVELRTPSNEEQAIGHRTEHAFCTASSVVEPSEKVRNVFAKIAANEIIPKDSDWGRVSIEYPTPEGDRVRIPPLSEFPEFFRSFVKNAKSELHDFATRTVAMLRWRGNVLGPHNPISSRGLSWSPDESFWHPAPADIVTRMDVFGPLRLSVIAGGKIDHMAAV